MNFWIDTFGNQLIKDFHYENSILNVIINSCYFGLERYYVTIPPTTNFAKFYERLKHLIPIFFCNNRKGLFEVVGALLNFISRFEGTDLQFIKPDYVLPVFDEHLMEDLMKHYRDLVREPDLKIKTIGDMGLPKSVYTLRTMIAHAKDIEINKSDDPQGNYRNTQTFYNSMFMRTLLRVCGGLVNEGQSGGRLRQYDVEKHIDFMRDHAYLGFNLSSLLPYPRMSDVSKTKMFDDGDVTFREMKSKYNLLEKKGDNRMFSNLLLLFAGLFPETFIDRLRDDEEDHSHPQEMTEYLFDDLEQEMKVLDCFYAGNTASIPIPQNILEELNTLLGTVEVTIEEERNVQEGTIRHVEKRLLHPQDFRQSEQLKESSNWSYYYPFIFAAIVLILLFIFV